MDFFQPIINRLDTDILIIGGGAAGCAAAIEARKNNPQARIIIMEKAQSSVPAAWHLVLTLSAYITEKQTPETPVIFNLV